MEMTNDDYEASIIRLQMTIEKHEHTLFAMLKPSLQQDGNQWCVLYGDNLQVGVAGFGDSPHDAILDFNAQWYKKIEPKFKNVSCSSCGEDFGPGDSGFSHCESHAGMQLI